MTEPRRLKELSTALPFELSQALEGAPADPSELEQQMLLQSLGSTLGIALTLPSVAANPLSAASAANVSAGFAQVSTAVSLATKPGVAFLIWFGGGLTLGTVLSAAALLSSPPATSNRSAPSGLATHSRPALVIAPTAKASAALPESDLDAGARVSQPAPETAIRSSTRDKAREHPATEADSEFSLLRNAQQTLNTDPLRALDLCAAHARQFPSGVMVQEREMIGIEASLRLGRIQQADARASTFLRLFPGSAHAARLKNLLQQSKF